MGLIICVTASNITLSFWHSLRSRWSEPSYITSYFSVIRVPNCSIKRRLIYWYEYLVVSSWSWDVSLLFGLIRPSKKLLSTVRNTESHFQGLMKKSWVKQRIQETATSSEERTAWLSCISHYSTKSTAQVTCEQYWYRAFCINWIACWAAMWKDGANGAKDGGELWS